MNIFMKLVYKFMVIFLTFSLTSSHRHALQVENCDSNSRLVVDEDDNGEFRPERVISLLLVTKCMFRHRYMLIFCFKKELVKF